MNLIRNILFGIALMSSCFRVCAQTWKEVKADGETYVWGEGWGRSLEEADGEAMSSLAGRISLTVISEFKSVEGQASSGRETTRYSSIDHNVRSFSSASLSGSGMEILESGRNFHVVRWISRSEVEKMRMQRSCHILEYVRGAEESEREYRFSDALRGYYWAYALVRAYPELASVSYTDLSGVGHMLSVWLPQAVNRVLSDIRVTASSSIDRQATLTFLYRGRPADGVEFSYFDGTGWTGNMYAPEGRKIIYLGYNTRPDYLHIRFEHLFTDDVKADRELEFALELLKDEPVRKTYVALAFR